MKSLIVTGVTFGVFMAEAMIHYNMGRAGKDEEFGFQLPPPKEMAKIALVTGAFAIISGTAVSALERRYGKP